MHYVGIVGCFEDGEVSGFLPIFAFFWLRLCYPIRFSFIFLQITQSKLIFDDRNTGIKLYQLQRGQLRVEYFWAKFCNSNGITMMLDVEKFCTS